MKNLLLIAITILAVGCGKKDVVSEVVEPIAEVKPVGEKQVEIEEKVKNEKPPSESKLNTDGVKMDDLEFRDSIAYLEGSPYTGKGFNVYINGQKQSEINFNKGKPDGLMAMWYMNGKKQLEGNWNGLGIQWYENGQKSWEGNFKDGKPDGLLVRWYADGGKSLEMNYSEGKQHGDAVTWFENGKMRSEEYYRFGIIRAAKYWDNKGEPANSLEEAEGGFNLDQTINRKGLIYLKDSDSPYTGKLFEFHANSLKKKETNYKNGKKDGPSTQWYEGGQKELEINYKNGKQDGLTATWRENGLKWVDRNYKDGKADGPSTQWHENGQKESEGNYKDGKQNGLAVRWYNNGEKSREANYKDGKYHGLLVLWYANGQKMSERKFEDGEEVEGSAKHWDKGEPLWIHSEKPNQNNP